MPENILGSIKDKLKKKKVPSTGYDPGKVGSNPDAYKVEYKSPMDSGKEAPAKVPSAEKKKKVEDILASISKAQGQEASPVSGKAKKRGAVDEDEIQSSLAELEKAIPRESDEPEPREELLEEGPGESDEEERASTGGAYSGEDEEVKTTVGESLGRTPKQDRKSRFDSSSEVDKGEAKRSGIVNVEDIDKNEKKEAERKELKQTLTGEPTDEQKAFDSDGETESSIAKELFDREHDKKADFRQEENPTFNFMAIVAIVAGAIILLFVLALFGLIELGVFDAVFEFIGGPGN